MVAPHSRPPDPAQSHAGRVLGERYRVLTQLGRGGSAIVYRVDDIASGQVLALKQLVTNVERAPTSRTLSQFEREFQVLAQLAHPRVIAVYDYGLDADGPFYTMELLDGGDLKTLAPLPVPLACRLLFEVCSSLALLHSRRLVHRDVSPRNIRCTREGHAKLIDFGAMVPIGPCSHVVGTPGFVAPEVVCNAHADARTDLFSLGATLYFALTGRAPFAARDLSELGETYNHPPPPASELVPGIPPALDALCSALLRIEPARRPQSAFEVMRRLELIGGFAQREPLDVSQAYLAMPALVGRDEALRGFRQRMRRTSYAQGGALCFEAEAGLGRSRLLDVCALEAKTMGVTVVRAAASASALTAFDVARRIGEQLISALPHAAHAAADGCNVSQHLFAGSRLRAPEELALDPGAMQAALFAWITQLASTHALLIAVDDVQRIDPDSLALLAALAMQARELRLLLAVTCESATHWPDRSAFSVLLKHCQVTQLQALTRTETVGFLASIFGEVPQLALLGDRLYKLARGNPGETLALARHLVEAGAIGYENGQWTLPSEIDAQAFPHSVAEALAARIRALPALARRLLELQALLDAGALDASDYPYFLPDEQRSEIDRALEVLVAQDMLQRDGGFYSLSHPALSETLRALLDDDQRRERHLALYEFYRRKNAHPGLISQQLLEAGQTEQALDLLAQTAGSAVPQEALTRANPQRLMATLERALQLTLASDRPVRQAHELRRRLCQVAVYTDITAHGRFGPAYLAQLRRDSGLDDYRALPDSLEPGARLGSALQTAAARFAATPERERVYGVEEAIRNLVNFVVTSIVYVGRTYDSQKLAGLPELVEPFAPLAPSAFALWQNALAFKELMCLGQLLKARQRWGEVYERLGQIRADEQPNVAAVRNAIVVGIGTLEAKLGRTAAFEWAKLLDDDPRQRVGAMHIRRLASAMQGDVAAAERYAREAELLALRSSASSMFESTWSVDYVASTATRDVAGIKRVIDGVTPLAERYPGWLPQLRIAQGQLQLFCGDAQGALRLFTEARALCLPEHVSAPLLPESWTNASAGMCAALTALDRCTEAIALGEHALAQCQAWQIEVLPHRIAVALALAEAKHGRLAIAAERIERVLPEQIALGVMGVELSVSYEARARIAIAARDAVTATRFAEQALRARGEPSHTVRAYLEPLLEDARAAGLPLALEPSALERTLQATAQASELDPGAQQIVQALAACKTAAARAQRTLELLCELAGASAAALFLIDAAGELNPCATHNAAPPDAKTLRFARGFFAQQIDDENMTSAFTEHTDASAPPKLASYVDARGKEHRVLMLSCQHEGRVLYVGLVVLDGSAARIERSVMARLSTLAASLVRAGDTPGRRAPELEAQRD